VFAGSDEVSNNLNRFAASSIVGGRLGEYLRSLHDRFTDFDQLMVLDPTGRMLASSAQQLALVNLPADWQKTLRQQTLLVGPAYWDDKAGKGKLIVAVPVQRVDGRLLGAFAAELTLAPIQTQLKAFAPDTGGIVYLIHSDSGGYIASSRDISPELLKTKLRRGVFERLSTHENGVASYASYGREVVGSLSRVPLAPWAVVAEVSSDAAFAEVNHFRNLALLVIFALLAVVAATAYWLGHIIVRPLERLAEGAAEVSMGDLEVDLPDTGGGEVGALTIVFNYMVKRLREGREELQRLSVTDGLTGLTNHRSMMERLKEETLRADRNKHSFSVIMADVDHFKSYNDTFGHPAGDEVLKRVAVLLSDSTRKIDCVARYGGEEFAVLLPETEIPGALEVAERIRKRVASEQFPERAITLSIGVAEFPRDGDRAEMVIAVADAALYEAKRAGRNQVVQASKSMTRTSAAKKEKVLPTAKRPTRATKKKS
jgi:diguanylate cyclase (GGDEF)-like protein